MMCIFNISPQTVCIPVLDSLSDSESSYTIVQHFAFCLQRFMSKFLLRYIIIFTYKFHFVAHNFTLLKYQQYVQYMYTNLKLLLVEVQLPENTRRNSTFRANALCREVGISRGPPRSLVLPPLLTSNCLTKDVCSKRQISPCIFQVVASLPTKALLLAPATLAQTVQDYILIHLLIRLLGRRASWDTLRTKNGRPNSGGKGKLPG